MQDAYNTFEFHKIKSLVFENCKTELGKIYAEELKMFSSKEELSVAISEFKEATNMINRFGVIPIHHSQNALRLIDIAKKTILLTPKDLNAIAEDVLTVIQVKKYLNQLDSSFPLIKEKGDSFYDLTTLEKEMHRVITSSLTIADNATTELHNIRRRLKKLESEVFEKGTSLSYTYGAYLNDENSTIRDGHYVLPVKSAYKNKVPGVVHDISSTGNTIFIEPLEIVNLNNEITSLRIEENEEIRKILKQLTMVVLLQQDEIVHNNKIISYLDFLSAKYSFMNTFNGIIAEQEDKQIISLIEVRHPLIDQNKVVANDYHLDEEKRIALISGPNAGGKTVSLKTIGLAILMNQCALPVCAKKAKLGYFNNIFIDIGDNQSLSDNLSTFSAHISNIAEITNKSRGKDLVLIDELGTGTDPQEGEAIALSVIKYLENKHTLAVISSHFSALKEYAFLSKHVENSSMIFDEEKLLPTYIFKQGVPGKSYALDVASRYGLKEEILSQAREIHQNKDVTEVSTLIKNLQDKVEENTILSNEIKKREKELNEKEKRLLNEEKLLKEKKDNYLADVNKEKKHIIESTQKQVQSIISKLSNENIKLHEVIALKKEIDELIDQEVDEIFSEDLAVNDLVAIPSLNMEGRIKSLQNKKAIVATTDGIDITIEKNKLHKIEKTVKRKEKQPKQWNVEINTSLGIELNLIGLHVDEARDKLATYLDQCILHHLKQVRIIHGFGSGALRKMTHEYLKSFKGVTYRLGNEYEGGSGCTVVMFND